MVILVTKFLERRAGKVFMKGLSVVGCCYILLR